MQHVPAVGTQLGAQLFPISLLKGFESSGTSLKISLPTGMYQERKITVSDLTAIVIESDIFFLDDIFDVRLPYWTSLAPEDQAASMGVLHDD